MSTEVTTWLASFGATAFRLSALAFLFVNAAAVASVVLTRDRAFVNRWTSPWLAANLVLIGTGVALPLAATIARFTIAALTGGAPGPIVPTVD